jgi:hypothetical protein
MVKSFTEEEFKGWFAEFFRLYPFVTQVRWVQYTPYFNDGEPCEFGVHDPELELSASFLEKHKELSVGAPDYRNIFDEDEDDEGNEIIPRFMSTYSFDKEDGKKYPELNDAVKAIRDLFEAEDILKHVFGEHAIVNATPERINYEEYDHD